MQYSSLTEIKKEKERESDTYRKKEKRPWHEILNEKPRDNFSSIYLINFLTVYENFVHSKLAQPSLWN